jgi:hypothetical protein
MDGATCSPCHVRTSLASTSCVRSSGMFCTSSGRPAAHYPYSPTHTGSSLVVLTWNVVSMPWWGPSGSRVCKLSPSILCCIIMLTVAHHHAELLCSTTAVAPVHDSTQATRSLVLTGRNEVGNGGLQDSPEAVQMPGPASTASDSGV